MIGSMLTSINCRVECLNPQCSEKGKENWKSWRLIIKWLWYYNGIWSNTNMQSNAMNLLLETGKVRFTHLPPPLSIETYPNVVTKPQLAFWEFGELCQPKKPIHRNGFLITNKAMFFFWISLYLKFLIWCFNLFPKFLKFCIFLLEFSKPIHRYLFGFKDFKKFRKFKILKFLAKGRVL